MALDYKNIKDRWEPWRSFQYSRRISVSDRQNTLEHQEHNQRTAQTCNQEVWRKTSEKRLTKSLHEITVLSLELEDFEITVLSPNASQFKNNLLPEGIIKNKRQHACAVFISISPNMAVSSYENWMRYLNNAKLEGNNCMRTSMYLLILTKPLGFPSVKGEFAKRAVAICCKYNNNYIPQH